MKAIRRGTLPDGATVQVEDWSTDYPEIRTYGDTLAAYPKSKATHEGQYAPKLGRVIRVAFQFDSECEANEAFDKLVHGEAVLQDYAARYDGLPMYRDCF